MASEILSFVAHKVAIQLQRKRVRNWVAWEEKRKQAGGRMIISPPQFYCYLPDRVMLQDLFRDKRLPGKQY